MGPGPILGTFHIWARAHLGPVPFGLEPMCARAQRDPYTYEINGMITTATGTGYIHFVIPSHIQLQAEGMWDVMGVMWEAGRRAGTRTLPSRARPRARMV